MKKNCDREYWDQMVETVFINGGYGPYADAVTRTAEQYPEFREFLERESLDTAARQARVEFAHRLKARFREADLHEHDFPNPTPPHLRAQFLPFDIEMPRLAPSLNGHDGAGRISSADATPKQHKRHHAALLRFHTQGADYRQKAVEEWSSMIETLRERGIDQPENLTLAEILERLREPSDAPQHEAQPAAPTL